MNLIIEGVLKVKLPDHKQNIIKSPWRERYCVVESKENNFFQLNIFKANNISTSKLYQTIVLTKNTVIRNEITSKSFTFYIIEGQEIGFTCSTSQECQKWIETLTDCIKIVSSSAASSAVSDSIEPETKGRGAPGFSLSTSFSNPQLLSSSSFQNINESNKPKDSPQEEGFSSFLDSPRKNALISSFEDNPTQQLSDRGLMTNNRNVIGGNIEPSRINKYNSQSDRSPISTIHEPQSAPDFKPNSILKSSSSVESSSNSLRGTGPGGSNGIASKNHHHSNERLDVPTFTTPLKSSSGGGQITPFWMGMTATNQHNQQQNERLTPEKSSHFSTTTAGIMNSDGNSFNNKRTQISPKKNEFESSSGDQHLRLEITELIQLNNSLYEKIETLTETNQNLEQEYQNERLLFQQRLDDLKTKNLITNEECRTLREEIHKLKKELKDLYSQQDSVHHSDITETVLQQQVNTYKQLSESLTRENIKLTTEITKLTQQTEDKESEEKKSVSSIKLLLEKITSLESELIIQQNNNESERQFKQQMVQEKDELQGKLQEMSQKYRRVESELRTLQSRVQEEVQHEVSIEIERLYVLEEECSRLQKEIFTTKTEKNNFELENIRLVQEISTLQNLLENQPTTQTEAEAENEVNNQNQLIEELQLEVNELNQQLVSSKDQITRLQSKIQTKELELTSETERFKVELKDLKKTSKLNLQQVEGKMSKMQTEILRLNTELIESERKCVSFKDRLAKLELDTISDHDSRISERQSHSKNIIELQFQNENTLNLLKLTEEKMKQSENEIKGLKMSLNSEQQKNVDLQTQLQQMEQNRIEQMKQFKEEKSLHSKLQHEMEIMKLDYERDVLQYEEKLRRLSSTQHESKQYLLSTETKVNELASQLYQQKNVKEELTMSLQNAEEKCNQITNEVKRLNEKRKNEKEELETQLKQSKQSLQQLESTNNDLNTELILKSQKIDSLTLNLKKIQLELEAQTEWRNESISLQQKLLVQDQQMKELQMERNEIEKECQEETQKLKQSNESIRILTNKCSDLQTSNENLLQSIQKLEHSLQIVSKTKDSIELQCKDWNQSYHDCELRLSQKCVELNDSLEKLSVTNLELNSKNVELQSIQNEYNSLKKSFKFLEDSLKSSELCVETVNFSCQTLHKEIEILTQQNKELQLQIQQEQQELTQIKQENNHLILKFDEMKTQLNTERSENELLTSTITNMKENQKNSESLISDLKEQLETSNQLQQEFQRTSMNYSTNLQTLSVELNQNKNQLQLQSIQLSEKEETCSNLQQSKQQLQQEILQLQSEFTLLKQKFELISTSNASLQTELTNQLHNQTEKEQELQTQRIVLNNTSNKLNEFELLTANLQTTKQQLQLQIQQLNETIVEQERIFKEKLRETSSSLEDQLSAIYTRLSKSMTQNTLTTQTIQKILEKCQEMSGNFWKNGLPSKTTTTTTITTEIISSENLLEQLESVIDNISNQMELSTRIFLQFQEISQSFQAYELSSLHELGTISRELPSIIREKCVREICELESISLLSTEGTEGGAEGTVGLKEIASFQLIEKWCKVNDRISRLFLQEYQTLQQQTETNSQLELQTQITNLQLKYEESIQSLQDTHLNEEVMYQEEIQKCQHSNEVFLERIQQTELEFCRMKREKDSLDKILRDKLTSTEYDSLVGVNRQSHNDQFLLHNDKQQQQQHDDDETTIESNFKSNRLSLSDFDLTSIYQSKNLYCEESKSNHPSSHHSHLSRSHQQKPSSSTPLNESENNTSNNNNNSTSQLNAHVNNVKRNRGASVGVNSSRKKQSFPMSPQISLSMISSSSINNNNSNSNNSNSQKNNQTHTNRNGRLSTLLSSTPIN